MYIADRKRSNVGYGASTSLLIALATTLAVMCAAAGLYRVAMASHHVAVSFPPPQWAETPPAWVD